MGAHNIWIFYVEIRKFKSSFTFPYLELTKKFTPSELFPFKSCRQNISGVLRYGSSLSNYNQGHTVFSHFEQTMLQFDQTCFFATLQVLLANCHFKLSCWTKICLMTHVTYKPQQHGLHQYYINKLFLISTYEHMLSINWSGNFKEDPQQFTCSWTICSEPWVSAVGFCDFISYALRHFQKYSTYIKPIAHQRWAKTREKLADLP